MSLFYLPVNFDLKFASSVFADNQPLFVLRSVLGKELRSMCCVTHQSKCTECMYNKTCAYAFLFETLLEQNNAVVPGRNRASHPFAFTQGKNLYKKTIKEYDFTITLFGKSIDYLPYIYAAFVHAGKKGLFKTRVPFVIENVLVEGKSILIAPEQIDTNITPMSFEFDENDASEKNGEVLVELKTPMRFKAFGKYSSNFSAYDFMSCLYRRASTLCQLYGTNSQMKRRQNKDYSIIEKNLYWSESNHYSARQKRAMRMGGITGTFKLAGTFTHSDIKLLEFAHIANAGKNTNFGLGQFDFWSKWE